MLHEIKLPAIAVPIIETVIKDAMDNAPADRDESDVRFINALLQLNAALPKVTQLGTDVTIKLDTDGIYALHSVTKLIEMLTA